MAHKTEAKKKDPKTFLKMSQSVNGISSTF